MSVEKLKRIVAKRPARPKSSAKQVEVSISNQFKRLQFANSQLSDGGNMLGAIKTTKQESTLRAVSADFCRIFENNMEQFYLLSFLLTADHQMAEECFVRGLEDSASSNRVFKKWADSWARRTIIHNAIQMLRPRPTDSRTSNSTSDGIERHANERPEINAIVGLAAFERFVFVLSVLERESDQESALLLGCTRDEVMAARIRALQQIGKSAELHQMPITSSSGDPELRDDSKSIFPSAAVSQLTASA
jgi:DNA-directed RNA polymerase specialized sigma24 family protein